MQRASSQECPEYQPRLGRWGTTWRLLLTLAVGAVAWAEVAPVQWRDHRPYFWLSIVLAVPAFLLLQHRRDRPLVVAIACNALSVLSGLAAGPALLAVVSVATRRRVRECLVAGVASLLAGVLYADLSWSDSGDPFWVDAAFNVIATAAVIGWGLYLGSRRELLWTLRKRAEDAEAEQALRVEQARAHERQLIAREMHDVLAHRISQISMHAGALGFRPDLDADAMRASATVIQEKAHEALTDLRAVLGVLRDPDGELAPQPTYADLPGLVADARAGGVPVDLEDHSEGVVPDTLGRTIFRIVQEGITNARKHAPGRPLAIRLEGSPGERLQVTMRNPLPLPGLAVPPAPGSGLGLVGMSERAALAGGGLEHHATGDAFVLRAWLPWPA